MFVLQSTDGLFPKAVMSNLCATKGASQGHLAAEVKMATYLGTRTAGTGLRMWRRGKSSQAWKRRVPRIDTQGDFGEGSADSHTSREY